MKFSESWLREWVNPQIDRDALSHQITMAGLEVDDVDAVAGDFHGVVIGHVVECGQHPDADKLRVTKVNVGEDELLDIVCGAANCRQGLKVAVAKVGAVLPGDFVIKKAKLRGQPSHGMLCSFKELGIDVESSGIIELPEDAPIGTDIRDYLQLNDATIDVDLTANRSDCLSIKGLAREVAILNRTYASSLEFTQVSTSIADKMAIDVQSPKACPRYLGRVIRNINLNAQSPLWMQEKLRRCGVRSIDPVVDVTNYVMLELGTPMHAFDLTKINGGIQVRLAQQGEKLVLLDGTEAKLTESTLIIADHDKPLAIAGIFGGQDSGVSSETQHIMLESAFFAPDAIRGRARSYGLHTDSSHRFERGVDPQMQYQAMERATSLLVAICGGEVGEIVAQESEVDLPKLNHIQLRRSKLDSLLGHHIPDGDVTEILTLLGCDVTTNEDSWNIVSPSWRFDIAIEEDLIEEVGRLYGYNNIPTQSPAAKLTISSKQEQVLPLQRVRNLLVDRGYHEVITYSFVEPNQQKLIVPDVEAIILPNPISAEMSAMRLSLMTGLLNTVAYNQKRQQSRVRIFESGLRFIPDQSAENGIRQELMLAGVISGTVADEHWNLESRAVDFFDLKGDVEALLDLQVNPIQFQATKHPALHSGQSAEMILDGSVIGYIGTVHPEVARKFNLNGRTIIFEIEYAKIAERLIPEAVALSKFPANKRDIAVIVNNDIPAANIVNACLATQHPLLRDAMLFDLYTGKGIEEGKKSLAISLMFQSNEKTLEEQDMTEAVSMIIEALSQQFGAYLRD